MITKPARYYSPFFIFRPPESGFYCSYNFCAILLSMAVLDRFNIIQECHEFGIKLHHCPPVLFLMMGFLTIVSMVATYLLASRFVQEPEIAALIVIIVTVLLLIVGNAVIVGFNKIAEASKMQSEFISITSHQLRSPLSVMKWTLDATRRELQQTNVFTNPEVTLDTLHKTVEHMIRLVNSLLTVRRIEENSLSLKKEEVSLEQITKNLVEGFRAYAHASNISLELRIDPPIPLIIGDRDYITMVVQNLVDNAIRYSRTKGTVEIVLRRRGTTVHCSIKDAGVGIPLMQQPQVFHKFFRAANGIKFQTEGTGIGLFIAKGVVEQMGGNMGFESKEGQGSRFWFTIPIKV